MGKKIKDLTDIEVNVICSNCDYCESCPLFGTTKCFEFNPDKDDWEIEVDE